MKAVRIALGLFLLAAGIAFFLAACSSALGDSNSKGDNSSEQTEVATETGSATEATVETSMQNNSVEITLAEFESIQTGMSYDEVVQIIGGEGTILSQVDIGDPELATQIYTWDGNGIIGANANVTFQGNKVIAKAQVGLS